MPHRTFDLFEPLPAPVSAEQQIGEGAWLLRGFALALEPVLLEHIAQLAHAAPFRRFQIPGARIMSVAMTNCGELGWTSDLAGYRYNRFDPQSHRPWPRIPALFADLARRAAQQAGYPRFTPQACLINQYLPGTRLSLHRDQDESDLTAPIVSVSLGVSTTFQWGGLSRTDRLTRFTLDSGDVLVWGGASRMTYHGIEPLRPSHHPRTGNVRLNLTFRRVDPPACALDAQR